MSSHLLTSLFRHMREAGTWFWNPGTCDVNLAEGHEYIVTTPKVLPFCIQWSIMKYSFFQAGDVIHSGPFTIGSDQRTKWQMECSVKGSSMTCCLFAYLTCLTDSGARDVQINAKFTISVKSCSSKYAGKYLWDAGLVKFSRNMTKTHGGRLISIRELQAYASNLLPNDTLTITCKGELMNGSESEHLQNRVEVPAPGLSSDLKNMLNSGTGSDVTLIVGSATFHAHKLILCARSQVFAAMFQHDTLENRKGEVVISDMKPEVLESLIFYMYTDQRPANLLMMAMELMAAAHKYMLPRLQSMCEACLARTLTVDNVLERLNFSMLYDFTRLKSICLQFAKSNMIEVKKSPTWNECANSEVFKVLLEVCSG